MLSYTEKNVLKTILENDGQLKTPEDVAQAMKGRGDVDLVQSALNSLISDGYVQDSGWENHDGSYIMDGPFWTVDQNVNPLIQGGLL